MEFAFEDIKFVQENGFVKGVFLKIFFFKLENEELKKIGDFKVVDEKLVFNSEKARKFDAILSKAFNNLVNSLNGKRTVYVHKNSGIPLIGNVSFGIIDRDTNIIEIKPITSCNLNCIYCSVTEEKRPVDFVVEAEYMTEELKKLIDFKECDDIEIHIGCQGEPLRYAKLEYLISEIKKINAVKRVSMDTNATMLTRVKVDSLIKAGLTRFNISLNAVDEQLAKKIANKEYDMNKVLEIIEYIAKKECELIIAPVWVPGINDNEIGKIIEFALKLKKKQEAPLLGIQKYLKYRYGRQVKEQDWNEFYLKLREMEKKHSTKLVLDETMFHIKKTKSLPKPFKKGEIVKAEIVSAGRLNNEKLAVSKERTISLITDKKGTVNIKIMRTKHNIFSGELIN